MLGFLLSKLHFKVSNDKHYLELLRGSGVAFLLRIVSILVGYIFTLLVTNGFGAEAMGVFSLSFTLFQISSVIGRLGMDTALLRFTAEYSSQGKGLVIKEIYRKIIKLILPFSVTICVLFFFFSPYIAKFIFNKPYLGHYFRIMSLGIVPYVLLFINTESLRGLKKIKEYIFLQQVGVFLVATIVLALIVFWGSAGYELKAAIPIYAYVFSVAVISLVAFVVWRRYLSSFSTSIRSEISTFSYSYILSVSLPLFFSGSLAFIMGWTDTIMLGMFRSEKEVGIYSVVLKLSMIVIITLMAVNTIAAPKFAEFWGRGDKEGLKKFARQSAKLTFFSSLPLLFIFLFFSKPILGIFGNEFKVGAGALIVLAIGQFINAAAGSVGYILQMTGYQKFHQNVVFLGAIMNIILNFWLIPLYGILGAAVASTIVRIFWNVIFSIKVKKILGDWVFYFPKLGKRKFSNEVLL